MNYAGLESRSGKGMGGKGSKHHAAQPEEAGDAEEAKQDGGASAEQPPATQHENYGSTDSTATSTPLDAGERAGHVAFGNKAGKSFKHAASIIIRANRVKGRRCDCPPRAPAPACSPRVGSPACTSARRVRLRVMNARRTP